LQSLFAPQIEAVAAIAAGAAKGVVVVRRNSNLRSAQRLPKNDSHHQHVQGKFFLDWKHLSHNIPRRHSSVSSLSFLPHFLDFQQAEQRSLEAEQQ
jgi:hypothetical protein